jgi:hypothetical protein
MAAQGFSLALALGQDNPIRPERTAEECEIPPRSNIRHSFVERQTRNAKRQTCRQVLRAVDPLITRRGGKTFV